MFRSISVYAVCLIMSTLLVACGGMKTESFNGVMSAHDFSIGEDIPVNEAKVSVSLPTMASAGKTAVVKITVRNGTPQAWSSLGVRFNSSMLSTGDPYFEGFAIKSVDPTPSTANSQFSSSGGFAYIDFGPIGVNETKQIEIQLQAVKPGGYGTDFTVGLWHEDESTNERKAITWNKTLYTVIK